MEISNNTALIWVLGGLMGSYWRVLRTLSGRDNSSPSLNYLWNINMNVWVIICGIFPGVFKWDCFPKVLELLLGTFDIQELCIILWGTSKKRGVWGVVISYVPLCSCYYVFWCFFLLLLWDMLFPRGRRKPNTIQISFRLG